MLPPENAQKKNYRFISGRRPRHGATVAPQKYSTDRILTAGDVQLQLARHMPVYNNDQ